MPLQIDDNSYMMKNEVENMTDQIPLGKQLKYALQEKGALQEMVKESTYEYFRMLDIGMTDTGITLKREQLLELTADLNRASEEVSDIELFMWEEEKRDAEEDQLREQEWMNAMDTAYEEGCFS